MSYNEAVNFFYPLLRKYIILLILSIVSYAADCFNVKRWANEYANLIDYAFLV